jgi:hypothetical protein
MLRYPIIRDWFEINLGNDGTYMNINEHPNKYRKEAKDIIDKFGNELHAVIRIDDGWYPAGAGPYLSDRI